ELGAAVRQTKSRNDPGDSPGRLLGPVLGIGSLVLAGGMENANLAGPYALWIVDCVVGPGKHGMALAAAFTTRAGLDSAVAQHYPGLLVVPLAGSSREVASFGTARRDRRRAAGPGSG